MPVLSGFLFLSWLTQEARFAQYTLAFQRKVFRVPVLPLPGSYTAMILIWR